MGEGVRGDGCFSLSPPHPLPHPFLCLILCVAENQKRKKHRYFNPLLLPAILIKRVRCATTGFVLSTVCAKVIIFCS